MPKSSGTVTVLFFVFSAINLHAQQRPLQTDDPQLVPSGDIRLQGGFEFLQNQTFSLSGLRGDLTRLGVLGVFVGAGPYVEFQVTGTLLNSLNVERRFPAFGTPRLNFSGNSTSDVGDFTLAAKFKLLGEKDSVPAVGFRFGVELPNAGNESGLGNDQTNFYASVLIGKSFGRFRSFANLGLAILDNPTSVGSQKDLFTYGVAATYALNPRWTLVSELNGRTGPGGPGTNDQSQLRLGAQLHAGRVRWDLAGVAGFAKDDPDSGIVFGLTYEFKAFKPQARSKAAKSADDARAAFEKLFKKE